MLWRCWHNRSRTSVVEIAVMFLLVGTCSAEEKLPPEGKILPVNGFQMYYEVHGQGKPLVLLHWFAGSGAIWKPYLPEFAKHYRLIVPDLRGHGRATNPGKEFTHRQSALDVYALLDALKIKTVRAIGTSTGGMTLIHMATQQPERVDAMVLVGATHYFPEQAREIQRKASFDQLSVKELASLRSLHKHGDGQIRALIQQFHDFSTSYDDMNFTSPFLSTIKARTLIVHGDRDAHFPVAIPVEMCRSIPKSYLWIVPNGGHVSFHETRQVGYSETLLQFLQGEWEKNNSPR